MVRRASDQNGHDSSWPTTKRPTNPDHGTTGYNETIGTLETWDAIAEEWIPGGGADPKLADVSKAQIDVLGVTPGTTAAGKAMVTDSDNKIDSIKALEILFATHNVTAAAGPTYTGATLGYGINTVTSADAGLGVVLPPCKAGAICIVYDKSGNGLDILPNGTDTVLTGVSTQIPAATALLLTAIFCGDASGTDWTAIMDIPAA